MGNVADVTELHSTSIFRVEMSRISINVLNMLSRKESGEGCALISVLVQHGHGNLREI
jgi:hypothetical protein